MAFTEYSASNTYKYCAERAAREMMTATTRRMKTRNVVKDQQHSWWNEEKTQEERLSEKVSTVVISVEAGEAVMTEKRRMKYCNGGRGNDKVREKYETGAS